MSEMRSFDPYTNAGVGSGGAAGVGAAGINRSKSVTAPYNAFAGPTGDPYAPMPPSQAMYDTPAPLTPGQSLRYRQRNGSGGNELDLLDAAGIGAGVGAAAGLARGPSQQYPSATTSPSPPPADLARNQSLGAQTLGSSSGSGEHEQYTGGYYHTPFPQSQSQQYLNTPSRPISAVDPYDGIDASPMEMPNPHSPAAQAHSSDPRPMSGNYSSPDSSDQDDGNGGYPFHDGGDSRASLRDEEDYGNGAGRRVLKVRLTVRNL